MRLLEALRSSSDFMRRAGVEGASDDAELIVLHAAGISRLAAYTENPEISQSVISSIHEMLRRRATGEPVQYIVGEVDFLGLRISVGRGVLVPRPETELLVGEAVRLLRSSMGDEKVREEGKQPLILDLCTGSGCIALALAREFRTSKVLGADISKKAIAYAKKNALLNGIDNIQFLTGPLFGPVKGLRFDLIVSNPPYIRTEDIPGLQREISEWEPRGALDGGPDGLEFYRKIFGEAPVHLRERGVIAVELGFGQAPDVRKIAEDSGFQKIAVKKDFAGIERILIAEFPA
jgi:release factor glutamine methyltransferase